MQDNSKKSPIRAVVGAFDSLRQRMRTLSVAKRDGALEDSQELCNAGRYAEARQVLEKVLAGNPDNFRALLLSAQVESRAGNLHRASDLLDHAIAVSPPDANLYFERGVLALRADHQQVSKAAEAASFFAKAIEKDPSMAEAHFHFGIASCVQTRHVEAIPHFRRATELETGMTKAHFELAKALSQAERVEEAKQSLERVLELEPGHEAARKDLQDLLEGSKFGRRRPTVVRFPNQIAAMQDLAQAFRRHVLNSSYPNILTAQSRVATFGSCFAGNVARALRSANIDARNTTFGEFVNSTTANRHYIDWVVDAVENDVAKAISEYHAGDPNFSGDREEHRERLAACDIVVMTVGVAPGFFNRVTGEVVIPRPSSFNMRALLNQCEFRTTSVGENVENLRHIISQLRRVNQDAYIVITVSPVPLTATFEYESAVVADCVSKSTLRVAVDELMREKLPRLIYWPSFELFRWLGSYVPGLYGQEDSSTIHASEAAVALAVNTFVDVLSGGALKPYSLPDRALV